MRTKDWLENRENFKNRDKSEYNKRAKQARDEYRESIKNDKYNEYRELGLSKKDALTKSEQFMKGKAALHNPDGIAGGKVDQIAGMGDSKVNSSIGSQWSKGRAASIENK